MAENGEPYSTFSSFWKACEERSAQVRLPLPAPKSVRGVERQQKLTSVAKEDLELILLENDGGNADLEALWCPGEEGALKKLRSLRESGLLYEFRKGKDINSLEATTSKLSPHLHFGEVSPAVVWQEAVDAGAHLPPEKNDSIACVRRFLSHLGLREYSRYMSYHFPWMLRQSLLEPLNSFPWSYDWEQFNAWANGRTGVPIVDAGCRELRMRGWVHNRLRVLIASFLIKHLMLPWHWGMRYFWEIQVDADLEEDVLGWQYVAGCMQDAIPFGDIMDPISVGYELDPSGSYIRQWVPELVNVYPSEYVHAPWEAPENALREAEVSLGSTYPRPIATMEDARANVANALAAIGKT